MFLGVFRGLLTRLKVLKKKKKKSYLRYSSLHPALLLNRTHIGNYYRAQLTLVSTAIPQCCVALAWGFGNGEIIVRVCVRARPCACLTGLMTFSGSSHLINTDSLLETTYHSSGL